jgi:DNA-binding NarL/FixJ family response regulator
MTTVLIGEGRHSDQEELARVMSAVMGVRRIDCMSSIDELLCRYSRQPADLVLIGIGPAGSTGAELTGRLLGAYPTATVIVFGPHEDARGIAATIGRGAGGYLRWDAARPELVATLAHALTTTAVLPSTPPGPGDLVSGLSQRELQVLRAMCEGKTNPQISRELSLSEATIKTHAHRIFRKLGVSDRAHAVACAFRRGLVS